MVSMAVLLLIVYLAVAIKLFGIPRSISDTFYLYNGLAEGAGYTFTVFMFSESFLMMYPMVTLGTFEWWQFFGFLCPVGIAFCGSAPLFKDDKLTKRVHYTGAIMGALTGLIWCFLLDAKTSFITLCALGSLTLFLSVYTKTEEESKVFWLEIWGFGTIATVLFISTL